MRLLARGLIVPLALLNSVAAAAEADGVADAIGQRVQAYVDAYNQHDAQALAELWADDAVYLNRDTGQPVEGREAIREMFASMFESGAASQLSVTMQSVRAVTDDVAIEDGSADLLSADGEVVSSTYTAIHVKKDGVWYLNSVRETDVPATPAGEPRPLDELAWLIGDWVDDSADATVRTTWQYTANRHFLTSSFTVSIGDEVELEGTQVIGWDAANRRFQSWVFDTEGGFSEGLWQRAGDNLWIVQSASRLADGSQGSATNTYKLVDEHTFTFGSANRQLDGESLPAIDEVTVRRQIADESAAPPATTDQEGGN